MVDISSQNNKINITVSSSGNTANTNVTPDYAQYYSEKSKEWAISNRIVDNTDYSSKYYANESKKQADISTAKTTEVIESGNTAISNIESARDNAITDITNQESLSVDNVNTAGATQISNVNTAGITQVANVNSVGTTQINLVKEQVTLATNQANIATEQATIATNKTTEVVVSGNEALSNIDTAKNNAITSITNQETTSKTSLIDEGATQIGLIQNEGATQIANVQSTGFYMRDDKLYFINSQGEETEFKSGGSGLEICDIGMALYVDETKGKRRYLNGSTMFIYECYEPFLKRLQEIIALYPNLSTTEENWQAEASLSAHGQVGKFVISESTYYGFASGESVVYTDSIEDGKVKVYTPDFVLLGEGTITSENLAYNLTYARNNNDKTMTKVRLPKVVNVQGLFDLQNLGMTVGAGLPNITGSSGNSYSGFNNSIETGTGAIRIKKVVNDLSRGTNNNYKGTINFNASLSNPIYGKSSTVQPEAIQYPYFIQIATGQETTADVKNELQLNNPYGLFDFKWADHELNNISWTRADNFDWKSSAIYPSAYNELLAEYNNTESVEETEGTVTFKRTPKGYKIALSTQEMAILNKYNTDGIAWYYILDTTNTQFKLPRTKYGFEGLRTNVGDKIDESLPNITGTVYCSGHSLALGIGNSNSNSALYTKGSIRGATTPGTSGSDFTKDLNINASRSSSTYQDNAPVQERATQMYLYFYVGETVQNANLIDAGRISEVIPNKLDKKQLYNKITNCLLEVPQRIKLVLENGKMHLYKGSVLTYGDGTNLTIEEDVIEDQFVNTTRDGLVLVYDVQRTGNNLGIYIQGRNVFSQDTQPTTTIADSIWFDTANNKMKQTHDTGATWYEIPLPIGIVSVTPNVWKSLDQVFNGMGYIGSTVWVDKGVKGLIPNGRNEDGSLNNIEYVTPNLITRNITDNGSLELAINSSNTLNIYSYFTVSDENYLVGNNGNKVIGVSIANVYMTNNVITSFNPKLPFRAVDYNEASGLGMPSNRYIELTLGADGSKYTAPANGWFVVSKRSTKANEVLELSLIATRFGFKYASTGAQGCFVSCPVKKGDSIKCGYTTTGTTEFFRFIYAEGSK